MGEWVERLSGWKEEKGRKSDTVWHTVAVADDGTHEQWEPAASHSAPPPPAAPSRFPPHAHTARFSDRG